MSTRRKTRMIGLHERAQQLLLEANRGSLPPACTSDAFYSGAHEEHLPLYYYDTPQGRFQEYVQAAPWLGGPVVFKALEDESHRPVDASAWTEDEMDDAVLSPA